MDRSRIVSVDADDCEVAPDAILDALQVVISDVDTFLSNWFQRLDHTITVGEAAPAPTANTPDDDLLRRIRDFQQEKNRWESKRDSEELELQDKADQLTEAWLRLEAEQRKFLQIKESHPQAGRERNPASESANPTTTSSNAAETEQSLNGDQSSSHPRASKQSPAAKLNPPREAAVQQFQRLKREIESSRPNSGQM